MKQTQAFSVSTNSSSITLSNSSPPAILKRYYFNMLDNSNVSEKTYLTQIHANHDCKNNKVFSGLGMWTWMPNSTLALSSQDTFEDSKFNFQLLMNQRNECRLYFWIFSAMVLVIVRRYFKLFFENMSLTINAQEKLFSEIRH